MRKKGVRIYLTYEEKKTLLYALANYANMAAMYPADSDEYDRLCESGLDRVQEKLLEKRRSKP